ncbi:MFS transporter [Roseateles sp. GG27B]
MSALMVSFGIGQLLLGPMSDRFGGGRCCWGRRFAGRAGTPHATIEQLVAWRALQGLGFAAFVVCARAMLRDWFEPHQGAQVMTRALTGLGVAMLSRRWAAGSARFGAGVRPCWRLPALPR